MSAAAAGPSNLPSSTNTAFKTFCLENGITDLDPEDEIFTYDPEEAKRINREQPWKNEYVCRYLLINVLRANLCKALTTSRHVKYRQ